MSSKAWRPLALAFATVAAALNLPACQCGGKESAPSWTGEGGEFELRVRDGRVPNVARQRFHSQILGQDVGLVVVTPAGYGAHPERRYPVVYVFPGIGGDEWTYLLTAGLASPGLKALFADPETAPIVVFGNPGDSGGFGPAGRVLGEELVAFVDRSYLTRSDAAGRSLEGFSLGGATVLNLLTQQPSVFGRAVASSSACYLLGTCDALRASLRSHADNVGKGRVLLAVGAEESPENRAINDELAPRFGAQVVNLPGVGHDWAAQLATQVGNRPFGEQVAAFHLAGFAR